MAVGNQVFTVPTAWTAYASFSGRAHFSERAAPVCAMLSQEFSPPVTRSMGRRESTSTVVRAEVSLREKRRVFRKPEALYSPQKKPLPKAKCTAREQLVSPVPRAWGRAAKRSPPEQVASTSKGRGRGRSRGRGRGVSSTVPVQRVRLLSSFVKLSLPLCFVCALLITLGLSASYLFWEQRSVCVVVACGSWIFSKTGGSSLDA